MFLSGKHQNNEVQKKMMLGYLDASNTLEDENIDLPFFLALGILFLQQIILLKTICLDKEASGRFIR